MAVTVRMRWAACALPLMGIVVLAGILSAAPASGQLEARATDVREPREGRNVSRFDSIGSNRWLTRPTVGHSPGRRQYHACAGYRNRLYVFGGMHVVSDAESNQISYLASNDLWMYFPDFKRWLNLTGSGPSWPNARIYHSAENLMVDGRPHMSVFGGIANAFVWLYDYEAAEFKAYPPGENHPVPRMLHSSASHNDTLFIYGGCKIPEGRFPIPSLCDATALSDVWRWSPTEGWAQIQVDGPSLPRFSASMFHYRGALHVLGGFPRWEAFELDVDTDLNHYRLQLPAAASDTTATGSPWEPLITPDTANPFEEVFDPSLDALSVDPFLLFNASISKLSKNVLPPRLGFSSVVQITEDDFLLIAGRSSQLTAPSNKVFRFHGNLTRWDVLDTNRFDTNLARRMAHCSVSTTASAVLTFAGTAPLVIFSDVAVFEISSESWSQPSIYTHPVAGIYPAGVSYGPYYVLHGGLSFQRTEASPHIFLYEYDRNQWVNVWLNNRPPPRRYGHTVNVVGNNLYFFGGATALSSDPTSLQNHIFRIDMDEFNAYFDGPGLDELRPPRRQRHSASYYNGTHSLYVFGGRGQLDLMCDMWRFDVAGNYWQDLGNCTTSRNWPSRRSAHVSFILDNYLYIYGGSGGVSLEATTLADVWRFDLTRRLWEHVTDEAPAGPRFSATATPLPGNKKVIIALGIDVISTGVSRLDLWEVHHTHDMQTGALHLSWMRVDIRFPIDRFAHAAGFHNYFRVFSGRRGALEDLSTELLDTKETVIQLGCNVGSYSTDFLTQACLPCPRGSYTEEPGQTSCKPCPGASSTLDEGSTSIFDCAVCEPGSCSGNGRCAIDQTDFSPTCFCDFGFSGQACSIHWLAIVLGTVLGGGAVFVAVVLSIRFLRRSVAQAKNDSALHQKLLAESRIELSLLERAWEIDVEDLKLYENIGEGSYGEVYRALWNESEVALKKLRTGMAMLDSSFVDEFQAEVRLQRMLRHRNVVLFFGAGVFPDGNPFLVTEYMRRGSLQQVLAQAWPLQVDRNDPHTIRTVNPDDRLSWPLRLQFARDAARGMTFLHEQSPPRLHRDIKSANFLVSAGWTVKVADFGTTTMLKEYQHTSDVGRDRLMSWTDATTLTQGIGTICWCAPEVLEGSRYGLPCDVYSYAILMWEVETCRLPYEDVTHTRTIPSLVKQGIRPQLPDPLLAREHVVAFRRIMTQCWQGDPEQRPTFRHVLDSLEQLKCTVTYPQEDGEDGVYGAGSRGSSQETSRIQSQRREAHTVEVQGATETLSEAVDTGLGRAPDMTTP